MAQKPKPPVKARPEDLDETLADPVKDKKARRKARAAKENGGAVPDSLVAPITSNGVGEQPTDLLASLQAKTVVQEDPGGEASEIVDEDEASTADDSGSSEPERQQPPTRTLALRPNAGTLVQVPTVVCQAEPFLQAAALAVAEEIRSYVDSPGFAALAGDNLAEFQEALREQAAVLESTSFRHERCIPKLRWGVVFVNQGAVQREATSVLARYIAIERRGGEQLMIADVLGETHPYAACCWPHRGYSIGFSRKCQDLARQIGLPIELRLLANPFWVGSFGKFNQEASDRRGRRAARATTSSSATLIALGRLSRETKSVISRIAEAQGASEDSLVNASNEEVAAFASYLDEHRLSPKDDEHTDKLFRQWKSIQSS